MQKQPAYQLIRLPAQLLTAELPNDWMLAEGLEAASAATARYADLSLLPAIVEHKLGTPVWAPTFFLAKTALNSEGLSTDSPRTYAECIVHWMNYLGSKKCAFEDADEEQFQLYSVQMKTARLAATTRALRLSVVRNMHKWSHRNGFQNLLGEYLLGADKIDLPKSPRKPERIPRILSIEELNRIYRETTPTFKLAFQWGVITGARRIELSRLQHSDLPSPQALSVCSDGLAQINIVRKGGKPATLIVLARLAEDTNWYWITERKPANPGITSVFLNRLGLPMSRQTLSREFRRCATAIGSDATLHNLRHTFATIVDEKLQESSKKINSTKTLQVLLAHSQPETVEIYRTAREVTSAAVMKALGYLYGEDVR